MSATSSRVDRPFLTSVLINTGIGLLVVVSLFACSLLGAVIVATLIWTGDTRYWYLIFPEMVGYIFAVCFGLEICRRRGWTS